MNMDNLSQKFNNLQIEPFKKNKEYKSNKYKKIEK